ncbi:protein HEG-like [Amblyraja radiata]|uniref:protein HEG-like n=1 Tax=Amblyraja radiata TaxID=386614 RepID=UPI001401FA8E|nr:protein HEG-like [Amblyraja radiata]
MAMKRGATSSCLFVLICYVAASTPGSNTTMDTTGTFTKTSSSTLSTAGTTWSPSNSTSPVAPTSMATEQASASSSASGNTTLVVSSSTAAVNAPLPSSTSTASGNANTTAVPGASANGNTTPAPATGNTTMFLSSSMATGNTTMFPGSSAANVNTSMVPGSGMATVNTTMFSSSSTANVNTSMVPGSGMATVNTTMFPSSSSVNVNTTLISGATTTGALVSNTSSTTVSIANETSTSAQNNMSTDGTMATGLNSSFVSTSSQVNQTGTVTSAPTTLAVTPSTIATENVTQTSTFDPTAIATLPSNASTNSTSASTTTNTTVPTTVSKNETFITITPNTTLTSTPVPTMLVNTTALTTNVPNSNMTTHSPKTSAMRPAVQCLNVICPFGSKCVNLFASYICRCLPGQYVQDGNCVIVRTFPGVLHLSTVNFLPAMSEMNSRTFFETASKIEKELKRFFKNDHSYYRSIVWKLEKGSVKAFVDNIFSTSSNATEASVIQNIKAGIRNCSNCSLVTTSDSYAPETLCNLNFCDINTSKCKANNGIGMCSCLPGYYKFVNTDRSCKACPSGFKVQNGACVKCPFGYGGFNCDKSYLLALVVVSCVLGGILLLLLLALMGTCLRLRSGAYSSSSGSHDYVMWPKSEMPKIPRATMHWDGNQLEMQENGSTSSLTDIHREGGRTPEKNDDLKTFKGKQQSRYTYLCQGQENPYYVSDEKKPEYL